MRSSLPLFPFRRRDAVPRHVLFSLAISKLPIFVLQEILFPSAVPLLLKCPILLAAPVQERQCVLLIGVPALV